MVIACVFMIRFVGSMYPREVTMSANVILQDIWEYSSLLKILTITKKSVVITFLTFIILI